MKLCKKQKFLESRLQRPVAARNDVIAKKIASGRPETGLLAARVISIAEYYVEMLKERWLLSVLAESCRLLRVNQAKELMAVRV